MCTINGYGYILVRGKILDPQIYLKSCLDHTTRGIEKLVPKREIR